MASNFISKIKTGTSSLVESVSANISSLTDSVSTGAPPISAKEREKRDKERNDKLLQEHEERLENFLNGIHNDYVAEVTEDTIYDKASRVGKWGLSLAADFYGSRIAKAAKFLVKASHIGVAAFVFRQELADIVGLLGKLIGSSKVLDSHHTAAGLYYLFAERKLIRGANPSAEADEHAQGQPGVIEAHAPPEFIIILSHYISLVQLSYSESPTQAQWLAADYKLKLVMSKCYSNICQPAYQLMASPIDFEDKELVLAIRGTDLKSQDVITDSKLRAAKLLTGLAHEGIMSSAEWLINDQKLGDTLRLFRDKGYRIVLLGHSLGGAVAAIMGLLLRDDLPDTLVYAYAPPPCVCETLASHEWLLTHVKTVVMRDDVVCRASGANAAGLATEIKERRKDWEPLMKEDFESFKARAATLWAPARRQPVKAWTSDTVPDHPASDSETTQEEKKKRTPPPRPMPPRTGASASAASAVASVHGRPLAIEPNEDMEKELASAVADHVLAPGEQNPVEGAEAKETASESGVNSDEEVSHLADTVCDIMKKKHRMVLPGEIVHIYFYQGIYRAALVSHHHPTFRRIQMYINLVDDHKLSSILKGLCSVTAAEYAWKPPPTWQKCSDDDAAICYVCKHDVTWADTCSSDAQKSRAMHHCHGCGKVICGACSTRRSTFPCYGIPYDARACDFCYWKSHQFFKKDLPSPQTPAEK